MHVLMMFSVKHRSNAEVISDEHFEAIKDLCRMHCENLGIEEVPIPPETERFGFELHMDMAYMDFRMLEEDHNLYLPGRKGE